MLSGNYNATTILNQNKVKESDKLNKIFQKVLQSRNQIDEKVKKRVDFSPPIFLRNDMEIIHPFTINVVQGKTGSHKSRLVSHFCSLLIGQFTEEMAGVRKSPKFTKKVKLLYVDTERNQKDQFPFALQEIKKKAGYRINDDVEALDFISLIEVSRTKRLSILKQYLEKVRNESEGLHIFVILDVVSDCISNFNNVGKSLELIDMLNIMINQFDITFICIIHENPGFNSEKARGHLGTELMNKASCQLQIGYELNAQNKPTDLIKVRPLKVRVGKAPEPFYLTYCDDFNGLIEANEDMINNVKQSKKQKADIEAVKDFLYKHLPQKTKMPLSELSNLLKDHFKCSHNTIRERIKRMIETKEIVGYHDGLPYFLSESKEGREKYYSLKILVEDTQKPMF